ncbi:hypothetical protein [Streptomyces lincolnensis]|nr:hypothetical protein [Streptomyces lincolnensis]
MTAGAPFGSRKALGFHAFTFPFFSFAVFLAVFLLAPLVLRGLA